MGNNIDNRAQFQGGYLFVKTDKQYYNPGEKVLGKIYIRSQFVLDATHMEIRVKGKEKSSFWYSQSDGKNNTRRKARYNHKHIDCKFTVFTFQGPLQPGDYTIPFEFDLPLNLPASCVWKRRDNHDKPSIKVKYSVKSILHTRDKKILKYKQWLVIQEPPVQLQENSTTQMKVPISTCYCCLAPSGCGSGAGSTEMMVSFEKNVFYPYETANSLVTVNNSDCKQKIKEVEFQVTQKVFIGGDWGRKFYKNFDILENKDRSGIEPNQGEVTKSMQLNLGVIKYHVNPQKKKKTGMFSNTMVNRSPEEIFQLSQIAPACHSKYVKCDYVLNANVKYDLCQCCANVPNISIPMTIVPIMDPNQLGFAEPEGYQPFELGYFKFVLPPVTN